MKNVLRYAITFLVLFLLSIKIVYASEGVTYYYEVTGAHIEYHIETVTITKRNNGEFTSVCNKFEGCTYSLETTQSIVSIIQVSGSNETMEIEVDKRNFEGGRSYPITLGKLQKALIYVNNVARGSMRITYVKKDQQGFDWYNAEMVFGGVRTLKSIEKRKGGVGIEEIFINQFGNITYKKLIKDPGI